MNAEPGAAPNPGAQDALRLLESRTVFASWSRRRPGDRRNVAAAGQVLDALVPRRAPVVVVTGSKGKGHVATAVAARLSAAGVRTGLVTSPGIVSNRDRFALDGVVVGTEAYRAGLQRLARVLDAAEVPQGSYLAPTGLFTVLGHAILSEAGAQAVVHEAGMGGAHDEVSLFEPLAVALASVFPEHLDVFGPTLEHVAQEKFGLVHGPAPVCSVPQDSSIADLLARRCADHGAPLEIVPPGPFPVQNDVLARATALASVRELDRAGLLETPLADALSRAAADVVVRRPGRGQSYPQPAGGEVVVDACIDPVGLASVLDRLAASGARRPRVLWSVPMTKDVVGITALLEARGLEHAFIRLEDPEHDHLDYELPEEFAHGRRVLGLHELLEALAVSDRTVLGAGEPVLLAGTISFGTAVLRRLGVQAERLYTAS